MCRLKNLVKAREVRAEIQKSGRWCGENVRYGWMVENGEVVKNPYEQVIIAEIKRLRARGRTFTTIARVLTTCGSRTRHAKAWNRQVVARIAKRENENK